MQASIAGDDGLAGTARHQLPDALVDLIARRFQVLGEPMRIRILDHLRGGEASVQELTEALGTSQQNVSKHLGVLLGERIVSRRKQGISARYWISDESVLALCEQVCGSLEQQLASLLRAIDRGHEAATPNPTSTT